MIRVAKRRNRANPNVCDFLEEKKNGCDVNCAGLCHRLIQRARSITAAVLSWYSADKIVTNPSTSAATRRRRNLRKHPYEDSRDRRNGIVRATLIYILPLTFGCGCCRWLRGSKATTLGIFEDTSLLPPPAAPRQPLVCCRCVGLRGQHHQTATLGSATSGPIPRPRLKQSKR